MGRPTVASYCTTFLKAEMLHIYRQVTGLEKFQTFVVTKERRNEERYPFGDVEILPKPKSNFIRRFWLKYIKHAPPILYRGEFQVLNKLLARRKADLMHVYFGHTGVHLLPFMKIWNKPCIVSFHGADVMLRPNQPRYDEQLRELLQLSPLVLVRSKSLRERLISLGCPEEKLRLNRTGIPLDQFSFQERITPADGTWHFVQACRLIPKKGLLTTLKAFSMLRQKYPNVHYTIAGDGPMRDELLRTIKDLGLESAVELKGFLNQQELCALYKRSHVFLHPSELTEDQNQEGVPNSMLEAMATGLPVVATLHGGIPEAVENGKTGFLVPEKNPDELFAAMDRIIGENGLALQMGHAASVSVGEEFEQRAQIAKLESYYAEALEIAGSKK